MVFPVCRQVRDLGGGADVRYSEPVAWRPDGRRLIDHPDTDQENTVAATCDVCGKGPSFGHSISHSHRRTKRRWNPNIQRVRAMVGSTPKRLNVCTSCLKAGKVTR
ncbi:ribosomal protein L28 [Ornithinimicrobium cerasi]|uniref:Large ribosomal subunit protein bL28 n=1 Tax=Ornithinimicrobium cerasi TaxID=2248773 RepID=A0A285VMQ5_9MICO|nr:ribosomal protein L28 [Ornithinimicrobium cerasi]